MKAETLRKLLTESSTSDGGTLWLVLEPMTGEATLDDILVEIRNEQHLFNIVLGTVDKAELAQYRLFMNYAAAKRLADTRLSGSASV